MRGLVRMLAKRAVMLPLIVLAVLALGVVAARAGTPTITDVTTPPAGHFGGACSSCHTVVAVDPPVTGGGADGTGDETGTVAVHGAHNDTESIDAPGDRRIGHNGTDTVDARGDQDDHETVAPGTHDRGAQSGDQGDPAGDQQGRQGGRAPAQRAAHVQHHSGSSDHGDGGTDGSGRRADGSPN